jgi:hypothetical protein
MLKPGRLLARLHLPEHLAAELACGEARARAPW